MRILVVEDDFVSRLYLCEAVSRFGKCDTACDGMEAITAFQLAWNRNEPYNLIFMDIMMPNLDGIGALNIIRKLEKKEKNNITNKVSIIMTSALFDKKTIDNAYSMGCESFLRKPIEIGNLVSELKKLEIID